MGLVQPQLGTHASDDSSFFAALYMSTNDCKSAALILELQVRFNDQANWQIWNRWLMRSTVL